jgi:hypothetical protein
MTSPLMRLVGILALAAALAGCGGVGTLKVSNIQTGRSLNSDNSVGGLSTTFKPSDTIYVAVLTDGSGSATIGAKFSHLGRVVAEPEKKVSYRGAAATEFHLDYAGGIPAGEYDIEVFFNGQSAGMRKVRVEP